MEQLISVHIDSPKETLWEGRAQSVSSVNSRGSFDILPLHATLVTLVEGQTIQIVDEKGKNLKFDFPRSVIFNHDNQVSIFTNL